MLKHDLPYYEKLTAQLKAVSKEIRQNVPYLKFQDDMLVNLKEDLDKQEKRFWELPMGLGKAGKQFDGIYPMIQRSGKNIIVVSTPPIKDDLYKILMEKRQ